MRSLQCGGTIGLRHGTEGGDASIRLRLGCETVLQVVGRVVVQAVQISEGTLVRTTWKRFISICQSSQRIERTERNNRSRHLLDLYHFVRIAIHCHVQS